MTGTSRERLLQPARRNSEQSDERHMEEEEALLTGQPQPRRHHSKTMPWPLWRQVGLFIWALLATGLAVVLAVLYQHQQDGQSPALGGYKPPTGKRNMIFMVSDGMGPTSLTMTRSFLQNTQNLPFNHSLVLDQHLIGTSRTRSSSSLITDSAAGATAFSCGHKSYNGAISVLPDSSACGTVMEAAKQAGYTTGLVVTTRITDATPACFAAHVNTRGEEDVIAEQEIGPGHPLGRVVDLILGGGRCHFLPNTMQESCRKDDKDIVGMAKDNGWNYISERKDFDALDNGKGIRLPLLGLFAETDIPYEIDRAQNNAKHPSLSEMTETALTALSDATRDTEQGFFVMIEGSRIDHAGHGNDPVAQVHEVLEYDRAMSKVLEFIARTQDSVPTVMVSTSDHETGGLATARQLHEDYPQYHWFPGVLANASHSASFVGDELRQHAAMHTTASEDATKNFIEGVLLDRALGITDASTAEIQSLYDSTRSGYEGRSADYLFADMLSRRAQLGWSTHGHSGVDVNIYSSSNDPRVVGPLVGNHENTEVGGFIARYLGVDLESTTRDLEAKVKEKWPEDKSGKRWMGRPIGEGDAAEGLEGYEGDFKSKVKHRRGHEGCAYCGMGNVHAQELL